MVFGAACERGQRTGRQVAQVHEAPAAGAVDALVAEGPERALEARLVVARDAHAREAQALAHLRNTQTNLAVR